MSARAAVADEREIIVTGERIGRSIRQTASSVAVFESGEIDNRPAAHVDQLLESVPNVQLGSGSEGPAIRGQDSTGVLRDVSAFLGGTRPRVTLQVDGRALNYYEFVSGFASTWDVAQVEVFRSPQTTTQGRNSSGGAIFVRTRDPTMAWEGRARAIIGDYALGQASAMVSGPIATDQVAFRLVGDFRQMRTSSDMADGVVGANLRHERFSTVRARLLATPRALPGLRLEAGFVHSQSQAPQFEAVAAPFRVRRAPQPERTNGVLRIDTSSLTTLVEYRLAPTTAWRSTLSWGDARYRRFALPQLGEARTEASDFSIESTLEWRPDGPLQAYGGVYRLVTHQRQAIDVTGIGLGLGEFTDRQHSLGLFGEATWRPAPRLALTGGLRFQQDRQDRKGLLSARARPFVLDYDETFEAWLPKMSIAYDAAEGVTAGVLVQRAFNPGGTTVRQFTLTQNDFRAETLWNYEAFVRARIAGGRGTITANAFYNDIAGAQRIQRTLVTPPIGPPIRTTDIVNLTAAESYGAEVEIGWRWGRRLTTRIGLGLLKTRVTRTAPADAAFLGTEFQRSPAVSVSAAIDLRPIDGLELSAQARGNSGYFSDDLNNPQTRINGYTVLHLRAAYTRGPITVSGYVRNLFDRYYLTYLFEPINTPAPTLGTIGDPRELGIGLEARF